MAELVISELKKDERIMNRKGPMHLFVAGPVSFAFYLGQMLRAVGSVQLYEYDFGAQSGQNKYFKSILVPRG